MSIRRLPESELTVMQALWSVPAPALRADIEGALDPAHPLAQTTVLTLLSRLSEKGFVRIEKQGRSARYTPLISREDYIAEEGHRFFHNLCGGDLPAFAAGLIHSGLSKEELLELKALLERDAL